MPQVLEEKRQRERERERERDFAIEFVEGNKRKSPLKVVSSN